MSSIGRFLGVSTAFVAAPLSPVVVAMPFEFMISRNIDHLDPIIWICMIFGYVAMFFLGMPLHFLLGKTAPDCSIVVKVGATIGALIPMIILVPLMLMMSLDENWWADIQDMLGFLVGGGVSGAVSGAVFWLFAYSWRHVDSDANK